MALTKKQRQQVWNKSGGKCWYCGTDLPEKGWHADHVEPIYRETKIVKDRSDSPYSHKTVSTGASLRPHKDKLENMVPACAPCNLFKATYSVEFFRKEIEAQIERVRKASSGFRIAERMGIIQPKPNMPVVFWFEQQGHELPEFQLEQEVVNAD
ncbi:HNH endonuclease [Marinobacterium jannaschii]|uniref:HNH endonuclease n=1 Tax=Marinobacterium jannaschii TaxID=64970 RepID=UPI0004834411|nr:HNH endonuclease signature motif containing protein [Marinobacterium jannaschii]